MSGMEEADAFGDDITRRLKDYLDSNPDVAEGIFGQPVTEVETWDQSNPTLGPGIDVVLEDGRRVSFDVNVQSS